MAMHFLEILKTSCPLEGFFRDTNRILAPQRTNISCLHIEAVLCVEDWHQLFGPLSLPSQDDEDDSKWLVFSHSSQFSFLFVILFLTCDLKSYEYTPGFYEIFQIYEISVRYLVLPRLCPIIDPAKVSGNRMASRVSLKSGSMRCSIGSPTQTGLQSTLGGFKFGDF